MRLPKVARSQSVGNLVEVLGTGVRGEPFDREFAPRAFSTIEVQTEKRATQGERPRKRASINALETIDSDLDKSYVMAMNMDIDGEHNPLRTVDVVATWHALQCIMQENKHLSARDKREINAQAAIFNALPNLKKSASTSGEEGKECPILMAAYDAGRKQLATYYYAATHGWEVAAGTMRQLESASLGLPAPVVAQPTVEFEPKYNSYYNNYASSGGYRKSGSSKPTKKRGGRY